MLDLIYYWAATSNPYLQWVVVLGVTLGVVGDHGGTRRIGVVIGVVTAIFALASLTISGWEYQRLIWLTTVNMLAAAPLLIHPITSRQQGIAATFLGLGLVHFAFAALGSSDPDVLKINWLISRLVDLIQAGLLIWWSWPHARERTYGFVRQVAAWLTGGSNALASTPPSVRAPD